MCDDGDGDGDGISLSSPVQSSPVQSGLSVWLSSSTARLNQYFLLASYLTYRIATCMY